jgi:eukaryotic translation initiation factor 2C
LIKKLGDVYAEDLKETQLAYDGRSNIFTTKPLPFTEHTFGLEFIDPSETRMCRYSIRFKFVQLIQMSNLTEFLQGKGGPLAPHETVAALDVCANNFASYSHIQRGSHLFSSQFKRSLGGGVEVWGGYYSCIRPTKSGLTLNVNMSSTTFYEEKSLLDYVCEIWNIRANDLHSFEYNDADIKVLDKSLKNVYVVTNHQADMKKRVKVSGISRRSAHSMKFSMDGEEVSVAEYFKSRYNVNLRYPNLPCVQAGERKSLFPLECCTIVRGQYYSRSLTDRQRSEMLKFANEKPARRAAMIETGFKNGGYHDNPFFGGVGLTQEIKMIELDARVLEPPSIEYGNTNLRPREGAWNTRDLQFKRGSVIENWAVLVVASERDAPLRRVEDFIGQLIHAAERMSISVTDRRPPIIYCRPSERDVQNEVKEIDDKFRQKTGEGLDFLLCMVKGSSDVYAYVKRLSDHYMGFISQCMLIKHVMRIQPQYIGNLLMKINAKLGGGNCQLKDDLPMFDAPVMVVGADVSHPSGSGRENAPSVVALVASLDRYLTRYTAAVSIQPSKSEEIVTLKEMLKDLLKRYRDMVGRLPARIIFFRDGVSEGQFQTIFHREARAIRAACSEVDLNCAPPVTFIVIQKRHHIRMFPASNAQDRSGNVLPGSVVDTKITHPTHFDFYMMCHAGIQGLSRPVRFYVLVDENGFSSDSLQQFIYGICHTNARCARSTSLPPPISYAHLVAYRGRLLTTVDLWGSDTESNMSGKTGSNIPTLMPLHQNLALNRTMFFL